VRRAVKALLSLLILVSTKKEFQLISFFRFCLSLLHSFIFSSFSLLSPQFSIVPCFLSFLLSLLLSPGGYWRAPYLLCPFFPLHDAHSPSHNPGRQHERKLGYMNKKEHMLTLVSFILWERGLIPCRGKRFLSSPLLPDRSWGPPRLLSNEFRGPFLRMSSGLGEKLIPPLPLILRLRTSGAIPLVPTASWHSA
jgi:hypothetical protein